MDGSPTPTSSLKKSKMSSKKPMGKKEREA